MIRIKIPATSANLGSGFDSLGLAVNLYNYVDMELSEKLRITSADETRVPTGANNLVYTSAKYLFDLYGEKFTGLNIIQRNNVPMTRGLGSSSTCIVGGLMGANALLGNGFSIEELVDIASKIEGHPDNTTPALLGGIVTAVSENDKVYWVKQDVKSDLKLVAIIPDFHLSTAVARKCLPNHVTHMDARFNLSRAALFSASLLQGKYENIRIAVNDKLHQPYRMKLINHSEDIFEKAYEFGAYGIYISGAGPTMMAIIDSDDDDFIVEMRECLKSLSLNAWDIKQLEVDNIGATIENI